MLKTTVYCRTLFFLLNWNTLSGDKYDAVFLDACDSSKTVPCPAQLFQTAKVYNSLSAIVKDTGALIVNILSYEDSTDKIMKVRSFGSWC